MSLPEPTARKTLRVLKALRAGHRLTVAKALQQLNVFALPQECYRLRLLGYDVRGEMIETSPGTHVKLYRLHRS
jgi:helix-turn-helix protein